MREPEISGGLTLDTYEAVLKWKDKKLTLVHPNKSVDSLLYKVLVTTDTEKRMPLAAKPLEAEQIAIIRAWIDGGAKEGTRPATTEVTPPRVVKTRKLDVLLPTATQLSLSLKVGPLSPVTALAFDPAGKVLVSGAYGRVTVWDLQTGKPIRVLTSVLGAVNDLRFSPDGKLLAVAGGQPSAKGDLRLFTVADWKLKTVFAGHDDTVNAVAFRHDGAKLASASYDRTARIWDVTTGKVERILTMHSDFVTSVAWSPDGKHLFSGSKDRSVRMVEASTGASKLTFSDRNEDVLAVAVHPDGKSVVATGLEPGLSWWNTETGAKVRSGAGHRGAVNELAFSKDGKLLASAGSDATIKLWNGDSGSLLRSITVGSLTYSLALSADGKLVAAGSFDGLVRLFDAGTATHRVTLLSLPVEEWLALTPAGYADGSKELLTQGRWRQASRAVTSDQAAWKALHKPDLVSKSVRGEAVPAAPTSFEK